MTHSQAVYVAAFLDQLSDRFGNDGCNDMWLDNTAENRELVTKANRAAGWNCEAEELLHRSGRLIAQNNHVCDYLLSVLMSEYAITDKELAKARVG